jgi:hypothetical protein
MGALQGAMMDTHVFLSYAREDESRVDDILNALTAKEFPVFIDRSMPSGVEWRKVLEAQLQRAYAVVVAWSTHSVKSEWVAREADVGLAKDRLFPILLERGVVPPERFAHLQAADLSGWSGSPDDPQFESAILLLKELWGIQVGTLTPITIRKPIRYRRPHDTR